MRAHLITSACGAANEDNLVASFDKVALGSFVNYFLDQRGGADEAADDHRKNTAVQEHGVR